MTVWKPYVELYVAISVCEPEEATHWPLLSYDLICCWTSAGPPGSHGGQGPLGAANLSHRYSFTHSCPISTLSHFDTHWDPSSSCILTAIWSVTRCETVRYRINWNMIYDAAWPAVEINSLLINFLHCCLFSATLYEHFAAAERQMSSFHLHSFI